MGATLLCESCTCCRHELNDLCLTSTEIVSVSKPPQVGDTAFRKDVRRPRAQRRLAHTEMLSESNLSLFPMAESAWRYHFRAYASHSAILTLILREQTDQEVKSTVGIILTGKRFHMISSIFLGLQYETLHGGSPRRILKFSCELL